MPKPSVLPKLSEEATKLVAECIRAPGDASRLKPIITIGAGEHDVSELILSTGLGQANVSKHLSLLATAGILTRAKDGQCVYYGMKDQLTLKMCELVHSQLVQ